MGAGFRIVFEEDGYPRELIDDSERQKAVEGETLTPDMEVTVYRDGEAAGVFRAGDIEELRCLFVSKVAPPAPEKATKKAPIVVPTPEERREQAAKRAPTKASGSEQRRAFTHDGEVQQREPASADSDEIVQEEDEGWTDFSSEIAIAPAARESNGKALLWTIAAIIFLFVLVSRCSAVDEAEAPTAETPVNETNEPEQTTAAPAEPEEVTAAERLSSAMHYVVRDTNVRQRPTTQSPLVGQLRRGDAVQGVVVLGAAGERQWLKVTAGKFAGYFLSAGKRLSDEPRPQIDTSFAGRNAVTQPSAIYAEPNYSSRVLTYSEAGATLQVLGAVEGFLEVSLEDGAVGYVEQSAFEEVEASSEHEAPSVEGPTNNNTAAGAAARLVGLNLTADDYPAGAQARGESGAVGFTVLVGPDGKVVSCRLTSSSGSSALDSATCPVVQRRAIFDPAMSPRGQPTYGVYDSRIVWRLQ